MIQRSRPVLVCFIFIAIIGYSCSKSNHDKEDDCIIYQTLSVRNITGPHTGSINQDINIPITYGISNGCGKFDHYEKVANGNIIDIQVLGKYTGCYCTQVYVEEQSTYTFNTSNAGTYYLKFRQDSNTVLTDTVIVQ